MFFTGSLSPEIFFKKKRRRIEEKITRTRSSILQAGLVDCQYIEGIV